MQRTTTKVNASATSCMHACIHTYGLESAVSGSVFVVVVVGAALGNCCDDEARFNEDSRYV